MATEASLDEGWSLLLYTDGLVEGRAAPGVVERFGVERLLRWLQQHAQRGIADDELDALLRHVHTAHGAPFADDTAVLVLTQPQPERRRSAAAVAEQAPAG